VTPVFLDCRPGGAWAAGHLEGALDADLNRFLSTVSDPDFDPARGGRHPLVPVGRFAAQLGAWGIGPETPVVCYDAVRGEMGACRAWWMLKALGHGPVSVLTEGIDAARAAGHRWTAEPTPPPAPRPAYPASAWGWPVLDLETTAAWTADPQRLVFDVRAADRWRGEAEALDPVAGRIPGTVNLPLGRDWADEAARWRSEGRSADRVAAHCGSGVSACAAIHGLFEAGFGPVALYVGSYSEWCRSGRPLGRGPA